MDTPVERVNENYRVRFKFGQAVLEDKSRPIIKQIISDLKRLDRIILVEVVGHTDLNGASDYNMKLSIDRARTVREYIEKEPELSDVYIVVKGEGETKPLDNRETAEANRKNRRVEVTAFTTLDSLRQKNKE